MDFFSFSVIVLAIAAISALVWVMVIGLVWVIYGLISGRLDRITPATLGALRGAFLLAIAGGFMAAIAQGGFRQITLESLLPWMNATSLLGAIAGTLWGYGNGLQWLHQSLKQPPAAPHPTPPPTHPSTSLRANPPTHHPIHPLTSLRVNPPTHHPIHPSTPLSPLNRARQGNPEAIATLIHRQLQSRGIQVSANRRDATLAITLTAETAPDPAKMVAFLQKGLTKLQPQGIQQVEVTAQTAEEANHWCRTFTLAVAAEAEGASLGDRARQGDADALTTLINRAIAHKQVTAQVQVQPQALQILLEAANPPDQATLTTLLERELKPLKLPFTTITLFGKQSGEDFPAWSVNLIAPASPPSQPSPKPRQPPPPAADPNTFVLEVGASRYEVQAALVLLVVGVVALLVLLRGGLIGLSLPTLLAFLPATIAKSRGRNFLHWYCYGFILFLVALILALMLDQSTVADFSGQHLQGHSFRGQNLERAIFCSTNLRGADFSHAILAAANFENADCTAANFSQAVLSGTNFSHAILRQASFDRARTGNAPRSLSVVLSSIPAIAWAITIVGSLLVLFSGMLRFIGTPFLATLLLPVLVLILIGLVVVGYGTGSLLMFYRRQPPAGRLLVIGIALAIAILALGKSRPAGLSLMVGAAIALFAGMALWCAHTRRWQQMSAWLGALLGVGVDELIPVLITATLAPWGLFLVVWGLGAIAGRLSGAWVEQGLLRFRWADLTDATFNRAALADVDLSNALYTQAALAKAKLKRVVHS